MTDSKIKDMNDTKQVNIVADNIRVLSVAMAEKTFYDSPENIY